MKQWIVVNGQWSVKDKNTLDCFVAIRRSSQRQVRLDRLT